MFISKLRSTVRSLSTSESSSSKELPVEKNTSNSNVKHHVSQTEAQFRSLSTPEIDIFPTKIPIEKDKSSFNVKKTSPSKKFLNVKTNAATWSSVERYITENNIKVISSGHLTDFRYLDGAKGNIEVSTCKWNGTEVIIKEYILTPKNEAIFLKELSCLHKLTGSPCALTFYGVTRRFSTARFGLVIAHVKKGNLANFLKRRALTWSDRISLAYRVALVVKNLHDNHIIHGYLVSSNILLNESFNPIIADFKRSSFEDRQSDSVLTEPSTGEPLSRAWDIHFLGILLWEIAAQQPIHSNLRLNSDSLTPRSRDIPGVPKLYETLYKSCWDSNPAKRPMIDEVILQLSQIREQVDGMEHNSRSTKIREELKQELKKERVDRADACRTHWFAHRYMPREGMVSGGEDGAKEPEDGINQQIPDKTNVTLIEDNILTELPSQTNAYTLLAEDPVHHYAWVLEAVSRGELRDIPYEELQKDSVVGRGNYGTVYHAKWDELDVAIKEYAHSEDLVHDVQVFALLGRHANIVALFGVTKNPETEQYETVLEYAARGNMHDFWDVKFPLTWPAKTAMAYGIACGLQHMHSLSVVHRGLDCENVLIRKDGSVALTGFSLSGTTTDALRITEQLAYRGPGQFVDLDKSDVYSLGILLWEILFEKRAFEDNYDPSLLEEIMNGLRPGMDLTGEREMPFKDTPPDYANLYTQCWDADPANWPAIENVVARLEKLKHAHEDRELCWEELDSVWIGSDIKQKTGAEITAELDKIHVHIIPYNSLAFAKKNFRRGGFADIHLGSLGNRKVAVKAQLKYASDVIQEVRILNMVANHRNIVEFLGITRDANYNNYIIMRLARTSLHELIRSHEYLSKPWSAKAKIALDIAQGLQHLHEKQIVHCDVHSGNVLVEEDGRALLTDFGLSRTFAEAQLPEFRIKIYGRLGYLAPELLRRPPPAYCPAHDIFGLGVLLWEIASSDNPNSSVRAINPARLQRLQSCPSEYQSIYQRCGTAAAEKRPGLDEVLGVLKGVWEEAVEREQEIGVERRGRGCCESSGSETEELPESMRANLDNLMNLSMSLSVSESGMSQDSGYLTREIR